MALGHTRSFRIALLHTRSEGIQKHKEGRTYTTRIISCFNFPLSSYFGQISQ